MHLHIVIKCNGQILMHDMSNTKQSKKKEKNLFRFFSSSTHKEHQRNVFYHLWLKFSYLLSYFSKGLLDYWHTQTNLNYKTISFKISRFSSRIDSTQEDTI